MLTIALLLACTEAATKDTAGTVDDTAGDAADPGCSQVYLFPELSADPANAAYPAPSVTAACEGEELVVRSNGIPSYAFVPLTPNDLRAQGYTWRVPLAPERAETTTAIALLGVVAFTVTGLPVYGPNEGEFPDPYGDPVYNGIVDTCKGHTGVNGDYHNHAVVVSCILRGTAGESDGRPRVIGYALDGFPILDGIACVDARCDETIAVRSGWVQSGDPSTYAWNNYRYEASDDPAVLDSCNGRVDAAGQYAYHATYSFPYVLGCYAGTPTAQPDGNAGGGGAGGGGGGGAPPDCADVPAGAPCCGDGVCDGPETADNCAADCG